MAVALDDELADEEDEELLVEDPVAIAEDELAYALSSSPWLRTVYRTVHI